MTPLRPHWEWRLRDARGAQLAEPISPVFGARFDAEVWLGQLWRALAAQGVATAELLHDGTRVGAAVPVPRP